MTVPARFNDGLTARTRAATVALADRALVVRVGDETLTWPLDGLTSDSHAGETRLSHGSIRDARLILAEAEWTALRHQGASARTAGAGGGRNLVIGLALAGAAVAAFVFVGMPALSGPLARATPVAYEQNMGRSLEAQIDLVMPPCEDSNAQMTLEQLGDRLESQADTPFDIRVRAVHSPIVNAFALPGGAVLLTSALIEEAEGPEEVTAVVAHEVAHIERRHVMQSVWRSMGAGLVLDAVVGGGTGAGQQAVILAGQVSDMSHSRDAETEADARGRDLLHGAGLASTGMAPFYRRMAGGSNADLERAGEFLSTHPDTRRRLAIAEREQRQGGPGLDAGQWTLVRKACASGPLQGRPWSRRSSGEDQAASNEVDHVRFD